MNSSIKHSLKLTSEVSIIINSNYFVKSVKVQNYFDSMTVSECNDYLDNNFSDATKWFIDGIDENNTLHICRYEN